MAAAQPGTSQLIISFFGPSPTLWTNLTAEQRASCTGTALQKQIEDHYAWPSDGELRQKWNTVGLRTYHAVIKTGPKPEKISPPALWLLSKSNQQETAEPYIVITCKDIKYGDSTVKHLKKNDQLTRFGIPYLCRKNKMRPTALTPGDHNRDDERNSHAINLCAARIAVYTGPAGFRNPKRNTSTTGCVLQIGRKKYALTAAHVFFDGVDTTQSWHLSRVSITHRSQPQNRSIASDWSVDNNVEPRINDVYEIAVESLWPHRGESHEDVGTVSGIIGRVAPRITHDRSNRRLPEIILNNHLDWALIELPDTAVFQPNGLVRSDGQRLNLTLPDIDSDDESQSLPPFGEVLIMCGLSGQISGRGLGVIGGIMLPWSTDETEAWSIECDIAVGDSGSLAVDPSTGQIFGMVVTHDPDIMLTYIVPIHTIIKSIQQELNAVPFLAVQPDQNPARTTNLSIHSSYPVASTAEGLTTVRGESKGITSDKNSRKPSSERRESKYDDATSVLKEFFVHLKKSTMRNSRGQNFIDTKTMSEWMIHESKDQITNLDILLDLVYAEDLVLPVRSEDLMRRETPYLRVFCLLLELGYGSLIHWCLRLNLHDNRMPFPLSSIQTLFEHGEILRGSHHDIDSISHQVSERQWAYCAFQLDGGQSQLLDPKCILPFIQRQRINSKGATAELYEVSVPENFINDHLRQRIKSASFGSHSDGLGPRYSFAVKTFSRDFRNLFRAERDAFRLLRNNKNFIQCYADFATGHEENQTFNLVLEYGDLDLTELFAYTSPPALITDICDYWEKMSAVVTAISDLHHFSYSRAARTEELIGSHHDIKPDNILVVDNKLKLADPGFALFSRTGNRLSKARGGTITYGPPEYSHKEHSMESDKAGQYADIWSLGCVLSEAATWVVLGQSGIMTYSLARQTATKDLEQKTLERGGHDSNDQRKLVYGDQFHDGRRVLRVVHEWHGLLRKSLRVTDSITGRIMDIIDDHMLVEARDRMTARELSEEMYLSLREARYSAPIYRFSFEHLLGWKLPDQSTLRGDTTLRTTLETARSSRYFVVQDRLSEHQPPSPSSLQDDQAMQKEPSGDQPSSPTSLQDDQAVQDQAPERRPVSTDLLEMSPPGRDDASEHPTVPAHPPEIMSAEQDGAPGQYRPSSPVPIPRPAVPDQPQQNTLTRRMSSVPSAASPRFVNESVLQARSVILQARSVMYQTVDQARAAMGREPTRSSSFRNLFQRKRKKDVLLSRYFSDREIIFLVDNAEPMKQHWSRLVNVLEVLASKVQGQDEDGFDVRLTVGKTSINVISARPNSLQRLTTFLDKERVRPLDGTATDMSAALAPVLSAYLDRVSRKKPSGGKDLSIIILTDGRWTGSSVSSEVATTLLRFFKHLQKLQPSVLNLSPKLGIEFVTFGDDPKAQARFDELDHMSSEHGVPDVVDVEPETGNVYKMLLGNFVQQYDYDDFSEESLSISRPTQV